MAVKLRDILTYSPAELNFGTSGLRGLVTDMTDLECYINTRGFLDFLFQGQELQVGGQVALAGDLRPSTPRILSAVAQGVIDAGCKVSNLGLIPLPAAAYFGLRQNIPVAVVTGSHIPDDRNGIKFYKSRGEVLKTDEPAIKDAVAKVRQLIYDQDAEISVFNTDGSLKNPPQLAEPLKQARGDFIARYSSLFPNQPLSGKKIVVYQHSTIAAEMLVELMQTLGAETIAVDNSEKFIAIDTENVTPQNRQYFKSLAQKYPRNFAIISADGDADRPFVVDETGTFHRGDTVGVVTAEFLGAKVAAVPISASDAVDMYLARLGIKLVHTKIGSPYVIAAMEEALKDGATPVVGWEVNGGFLTASDIQIGNVNLLALATRDSFLPIVCVLVAAVQKNSSLSNLFGALPQRYTQAGLIDNFPVQSSQEILQNYADNSPQNYEKLERIFSSASGFGRISNINSLDGIRISFSDGDIAHIRPSGNAPQLRIYSVANSQERADQIVALALAEPNGLLRQLEKSV